MAQQTPYPPPQYGPSRQKRGPLIVVGALVLVLVVLLGVLVLLVLRTDDGTPDSAPASAPKAVEFRRVVKVAPGECASPASGAGDVVCGADGTGYTLGAVELDGKHVSEVTARDSNGSWVVALALDDEGGKLFGELTAELAKQSPPANQLAIVVDDRVVSAPTVMSAITGGEVEISSGFSRDEAEKLAADISG
jgi:preprotein translocase subunit SecD